MLKQIKYLLLLLALPIIGKGQVWSTLGSGITSGGYTYDFSTIENQLYISPGFGLTTFSGNTYNGVCVLTVDQLDSISCGFFGGANDIIKYNGKYIFGGNFACVDGNPFCLPNTQKIAAWDSLNGWHSITPNGGANNEVYSLAEYNGELYVGGRFNQLNGQSFNRIAKWNGTTWTNVGGGVSGAFAAVNAMTVYHGKLYVSGSFGWVGTNNSPANYIATWDGFQWDTVSSGFDSYGLCLQVDTVRDVLYAGGYFEYAGGNHVLGIAQWNDTIWKPVGSGLDTLAFTVCMTMHNGQLIAGGGFNTVSHLGDTLNYLYRFDGTKWDNLHGGTNSMVRSLASYNGNLYVGGNFSIVGYGLIAVRIACYGSTCPSSVGIDEQPPPVPFTMYPNPNKDVLKIESEEPNELYFRLLDMNGKLISEQKFIGKLQFETMSLAAGTYIVQVSLQNGTRLHSEKLVIE
jgi:trimeric autotransporter adhesin